jgi:mono/diheme cytochrome c family protein
MSASPQAKRGMDVYDQECATCHGPNLTGGESGPALVGSDFIANKYPASDRDLEHDTATLQKIPWIGK